MIEVCFWSSSQGGILATWEVRDGNVPRAGDFVALEVNVVSSRYATERRYLVKEVTWESHGSEIEHASCVVEPT